jgi:hypothetical protein
MACPTCDHAMRHLSNGGAPGCAVHWCPRCGTIRCGDGMHDWLDSAPKLVDQCRQFALERDFYGDTWDAFGRLGIAESIGPPAERPPRPK